jgi:hypothetical protein
MIPKSECHVCKYGEDVYCPIHYVDDPVAEERRRNIDYLARDFGEIAQLTTSSGFFVNTNDGKRAPVPQNVFVEGLWLHVKPHLATYLVAQRRPAYTVTNDMQLIEWKFGRNNDSVFSTIVRSTPVLIIRLGFQLSTNAELANVLFETIRQRELDGPRSRTVIVNEPFTPWKRGHKAFSEELDAYLEAAFVRVKVATPVVVPNLPATTPKPEKRTKAPATPPGTRAPAASVARVPASPPPPAPREPEDDLVDGAPPDYVDELFA